MLYSFSDFTLDTERRELRQGADTISVAPQVFDLLNYLIRNRERVVSKDELIAGVWNGRIVSDAALTTRINGARCAIGDTGEKQDLIKTLPRKGFRFVGAVQEERQASPVEPDSPAVRGEVTAATSPSAARLSIVVLPFANLSGDPEQDYFADGVTESLTTDLSRIRASFVIGRHTAFTYKGKAVDLKQIGRELNVRYVLEGSVQRSGDRFRVCVQLVDTETGSHLWADRFDKPLADLFEMQDEIVSRLANALNAQLIAVEARRAERSLQPSALDLHFQGMARLNKGWTPTSLIQARGFFERALKLEPDNIEALAAIAMLDVFCAGLAFVDDPYRYIATAEVASIKAVSLDPRHAAAHLALGGVRLCTRRGVEGLAEFEHALSLNPNFAEAHACVGVAKLYLGRPTETEAHIKEALRVSPRDEGIARWLAYVGTAKLHLEADGEAAEWLRRSLKANPNYPMAHFEYASALALLGQTDNAVAARNEGLLLDPAFTIRRLKILRVSDDPTFLAGSRRLLKGMYLAGVPEG